jgi:ACR3 family arsenite transporter
MLNHLARPEGSWACSSATSPSGSAWASLAGVGLGLWLPGAVPGDRRDRIRACQPGGGGVHLGDDLPDDDPDRLDRGADVGQRPRGLLLTLVVNWLIKPFTMAALAVLFFRMCSPWVDPQSASEYIAGMILLGVAPCTAMVFVWSQLVKGRPQLHAGAGVGERPDHGLRLRAHRRLPAGRDRRHRAVADAGAVDRAVRGAAADSPAWLTRRAWLRGGGRARWPDFVAARLKPWSVLGLIATVVLLFGFQAGTMVAQPLVIALIAVPLVLQSYGIFAIAYVAAQVEAAARHRGAGLHDRHLELLRAGGGGGDLAVRLNSGAALATVVGVLVEVPVMLSLVAFANRTRHWLREWAAARVARSVAGSLASLPVKGRQAIHRLATRRRCTRRDRMPRACSCRAPPPATGETPACPFRRRQAGVSGRAG